jgi:glycosyltransferase involved in cell wall biosynthesis
MTPTVSAIIPTYNRAQFLPRALGSVLAQTQPVNEIIVVDDGSTDNTAEVIAAYGNSVRYLRQHNAGAGAARNHGLREARCDYVAFLDSDDLWVPEKTALQLAFLQSNPGVDFLFGDMANFIAENDNGEAEIKDPQAHQYFVENAAHLKKLFECLLIENTIPTSSVIFRRSCVAQVGFMDEKIRIAQDLEYWLRIALHCRGGFVNAILSKRRRHPGNLINNWAECNEDHARILEQTRKANPGISRHTQQIILQKLASLYYDLGSYYLKRRAFSASYSFLRLGGPRHAFDWKRSMKLTASACLRHLG